MWICSQPLLKGGGTEYQQLTFKYFRMFGGHLYWIKRQPINPSQCTKHWNCNKQHSHSRTAKVLLRHLNQSIRYKKGILHAAQTRSWEMKTLLHWSSSETELCPLCPSGKTWSKGDRAELKVFCHVQAGAACLLLGGGGDPHAWPMGAYATPLFSERGSKACNSAETCYLSLLKGLSNVIFSSTVALSNQGFCDAYATDPLFLGENKTKQKKPEFPAYQCSRRFWKPFSCKGGNW